jgi:hypothetical protein
MLVQIVVGGVLGLVLAAGLIYLVLTRAPFLFVVDKLPGKLYGGADEVNELVTGPDGTDGAGPDRAQPNDYE